MKFLPLKIGLVVLFTFLVYTPHIQSQTSLSELEDRIRSIGEERAELEREAERIREELTEVGSEKGALNKELARIEGEQKSLDNTIKRTQNEIDMLSVEINKTEEEISRYNSKITTNAQNLASILRGIHHDESQTILEFISSSKSIADFYANRDTYQRLQVPLITTTNTLRTNKTAAFEKTEELSEEQQALNKEQAILSDQKEIIKEQEAEKNSILEATEKKESSIKNNLATTLDTIAALDAEIRSFESTLQFALNKNNLPSEGTTPFAWPLEKVLVTQRFGKTVSSERLYVSGSHSGVDFRAAIGTPVYAVADGTVKGVGNTDEQCYRASFGKWIFIEHNNGLSTTSAHLSSFVVGAGDMVSKGDLIGYSGNSGRSTAPHLHLTVYATKGIDGEQGARITERPSAACPGSNYRMPLAPTNAYLDPLKYLPVTDSTYFKHN